MADKFMLDFAINFPVGSSKTNLMKTLKRLRSKTKLNIDIDFKDATGKIKQGNKALYQQKENVKKTNASLKEQKNIIEKTTTSQKKLTREQKISLSIQQQVLKMQSKGLLSHLETVDKKTKKTSGYKDLVQDIKSFNTTADGAMKRYKLLNLSVKDFVKGAKDSRTGFAKLGDVMKHNFSKFSEWMVAGTLFVQTLRAIKAGFQSMVEVDTLLTNINYTMDLSNAKLLEMSRVSSKFAENMSTSLTDALKTLSIYANANETLQSMLDKSKGSTILSNITGLTIDQTTDSIQGLINQFGLASDATDDITDTFTYLASNTAQNFAKSIQNMTSAVARAGQVANDSGLSYNQFLSTVSTTAEISRLSGGAIASGLTTIISRISKVTELSNEEISKLETEYRRLGIRIRDNNGDFLDMWKIMKNIYAQWGGLNKVQQQNVAFLASGSRQTKIFRTIMGNFDKIVQRATGSLDAQGDALKKQDIFAESITGRFKKIQGVFQSLWQNPNAVKTTKMLTDFTVGLLKLIDVAGVFNIIFAGLIGLLFKFSFLKALNPIIGKWIANIVHMGVSAETASFGVFSLKLETIGLTVAIGALMLGIPLLVLAFNEIKKVVESHTKQYERLSENIKKTGTEIEQLKNKSILSSEEKKRLEYLQALNKTQKERLNIMDKQNARKKVSGWETNAHKGRFRGVETDYDGETDAKITSRQIENYQRIQSQIEDNIQERDSLDLSIKENVKTYDELNKKIENSKKESAGLVKKLSEKHDEYKSVVDILGNEVNPVYAKLTDKIEDLIITGAKEKEVIQETNEIFVEFTDNLKLVRESTDNYLGNISNVVDAYDQLNSGGKLSLEQLKSLADNYDDLDNILAHHNGLNMQSKELYDLLFKAKQRDFIHTLKVEKGKYQAIMATNEALLEGLRMQSYSAEGLRAFSQASKAFSEAQGEIKIIDSLIAEANKPIESFSKSTSGGAKSLTELKASVVDVDDEFYKSQVLINTLSLDLDKMDKIIRNTEDLESRNDSIAQFNELIAEQKNNVHNLADEIRGNLIKDVNKLSEASGIAKEELMGMFDTDASGISNLDAGGFNDMLDRLNDKIRQNNEESLKLEGQYGKTQAKHVKERLDTLKNESQTINDLIDSVQGRISGILDAKSQYLNLDEKAKSVIEEQMSLTKKMEEERQKDIADSFNAYQKFVQLSIDALDEQINKTKERHDSEINALQEEYDLEKQKTEQLERQREIEQARRDLERAQTQKTARKFVDGKFVYVADPQKVAQAQEKLNDLIQKDNEKRRQDEHKREVAMLKASRDAELRVLNQKKADLQDNLEKAKLAYDGYENKLSNFKDFYAEFVDSQKAKNSELVSSLLELERARARAMRMAREEAIKNKSEAKLPISEENRSTNRIAKSIEKQKETSTKVNNYRRDTSNDNSRHLSINKMTFSPSKTVKSLTDGLFKLTYGLSRL